MKSEQHERRHASFFLRWPLFTNLITNLTDHFVWPYSSSVYSIQMYVLNVCSFPVLRWGSWGICDLLIRNKIYLNNNFIKEYIISYKMFPNIWQFYTFNENVCIYLSYRIDKQVEVWQRHDHRNILYDSYFRCKYLFSPFSSFKNGWIQRISVYFLVTPKDIPTISTFKPHFTLKQFCVSNLSFVF